jgi:hypothetical protein
VKTQLSETLLQGRPWKLFPSDDTHYNSWEEIFYGNFFGPSFVGRNAFIRVDWHFCSAECVDSFPCIAACQSSVMRT